MSKTLADLLFEHDSKRIDKWEQYLSIYQSELAGFIARDIPVRLLEIGVQNGGSLELWAKLLPEGSTIFGIDIDAGVGNLVFTQPGIAAAVANATNPDEVDRLLGNQSFDIIIDDGSHVCSQVIASVALLFPHLALGGKYFVEDLHCSYLESFGGGYKAPQSSIEWLKNLIDTLNADHFNSAVLSSAEQATAAIFRDKIARVAFYDSVVVVQRLSAVKSKPYRRVIGGQDDTVLSAAHWIEVEPLGNLDNLMLSPPAARRLETALTSALAQERAAHAALQAADSHRATEFSAALANKEAVLAAAQMREAALAAQDAQLQVALKAREADLASLEATLRNRNAQHAEALDTVLRQRDAHLAAALQVALRTRDAEAAASLSTTLHNRDAQHAEELTAMKQTHAAALEDRDARVTAAGRTARLRAEQHRAELQTALERRDSDNQAILRGLLALRDARARAALREGRPPRQQPAEILRQLVDADWYSERYPSVGESGLDPLEHYLEHGADSGLDPNPLFMTTWYLQQHPAVEAAGENPLVHYVREGAAMGLAPSLLFDTAWYLETYPDVVASGSNPLAHFLWQGAAEGRHPHKPSVGDARPVQPAVIAAPALTLDEQRERDIGLIKASDMFDADFYLAEHPDLKEAGVDPERHYVECGFREGRRPSAIFDSACYLDENLDVAAAGLNPVLHWITNGRREGRKSPIGLRSSLGLELRHFCNLHAVELPIYTPQEGFKVSVVTPTFDTEPRYLRELFRSLLNQDYSGWEWIIADDGSSRADTIRVLHEIARQDPRVHLILQSRNGGISAATNTAIAQASGDYIAFVDHDDLLARNALSLVWRAWQADPGIRIFYTDECKLSMDGNIVGVTLKADYSPTLLESTMYVNHLGVYERALVEQIGGCRSPFDGTQDYDMVLRAFAVTDRVRHVDGIAYLWRAIPGSAAVAVSSKGYAVSRQHDALLERAQALNPQATVSPGFAPGYWRTNYPIRSEAPLVSYVIPTAGTTKSVRGHALSLVTHCIASMERTAFSQNCEYIVVYNKDLSDEQLAELNANPRVTLVANKSVAFNFSQTVNLGARHARGDYVCLLNDDVEAITESGGDEMVGFMEAHPGVGAMGPLCLFEDGRVQHNGVVLLEQGPSHYGIGQPPSFGGNGEVLHLRREVVAVTGAMLLVPRTVWEALGGFEESLPLNYNDVDFCFRLRKRGLSCVMDPGIAFFHFESATKIGTYKCEKEWLVAQHGTLRDPYFNRGFDQRSPHLQVARPGLAVSRAEDPIGFEYWLDDHMAERIARLRPGGPLQDLPVLTVGVVICNQARPVLEEMYQSVMMQTYDSKELVLIDAGSSNPETLKWLQDKQVEKRATILRTAAQRDGNAARRAMLDAATGDFVVPIGAEDFISVDALQVMACYVKANPDRKLFYSDSYSVDERSQKSAPFFRPDFDPVLLTNSCNASQLIAVERDLLLRIDGFDDDRAAGSLVWDLIARAFAAGEEPVHVRELLYARRLTGQPPAAALQEVASQRFVLERLLVTKGLAGVLWVASNPLFADPGQWRLEAMLPIEGIEVLDARVIWAGSDDEACNHLRAAVGTGQPWIAILLQPESSVDSLLHLSGPARLDSRVAAVSGLLLDRSGERIAWSGGLFTRDGGLLDPYAGAPLSDAGYHGQLYCQRCIDVPAPADLLVRADMLARALSKAGKAMGLDALLVHLALEIHAASQFAVVTPHLRAHRPSAWTLSLPLDRQGLVARAVSPPISRWYGRLSPELPYSFR
ncbi:glycosyltransferase [Acidisphaera sp. L21]|uniref:glycosyltransferase n=1 Tax=Acidisphaera sp. L21 TaxID=1641851 RepID=UPI00131DDCC9|nr:glycosyltransferase [Acidisphaera sp. L21]